jgi:uncharacterized protein YyaL (SSP411 family)
MSHKSDADQTRVYKTDDIQKTLHNYDELFLALRSIKPFSYKDDNIQTSVSSLIIKAVAKLRRDLDQIA